MFYSQIPSMERTAVALGYFDGLHIGHREVIKAAGGQGLRLAAFSFEPDGVIKPGGRLQTRQDRLDTFKSMGVDDVISPPFSEIKHITPEEFVRGVLFEKLGARRVSCGFNYRFGAGAQGDAQMLSKLCGELGMECAVAEPVSVEGETVSSSAIRAALSKGDVTLAAAMLGRLYGYSLTVVGGQRLGRTLGAPTINQYFPDDFYLPKFGVYASVAHIEGHVPMYSVTNIGVRPTVRSDCPLSETWIPEYSGNLYDREVRVELVEFRRPEQKFESIDRLRNAIHRDGEFSRDVFLKKIKR